MTYIVNSTIRHFVKIAHKNAIHIIEKHTDEDYVNLFLSCYTILFYNCGDTGGSSINVVFGLLKFVL